MKPKELPSSKKKTKKILYIFLNNFANILNIELNLLLSLSLQTPIETTSKKKRSKKTKNEGDKLRKWINNNVERYL